MKFDELVNMFLEEFESNGFNQYTRVNSPRVSDEGPSRANNKSYKRLGDSKETRGEFDENEPLPQDLNKMFYQAKPSHQAKPKKRRK